MANEAEPIFVLADPDADLTDAAIQSIAVLLLESVEAEEPEHDGEYSQ